MKTLKKYNLILWSTAILFLLRVIGHLLVVLYQVSFLPPHKYWLSGLMPYKYLFPSQILILLIMAKILFDFTKGGGASTKPRKIFATGTYYFSILYFLSMIVRFIIFGISIPVVFHWVLALFLFTFSYYHRQKLFSNN